ncbi:MAG: SoxXA-binding protein [Gammaproteobacteria bacterium]|nr:SoxXA-binding protein [Gammaproteobacteria bacterium]
MHIGSISDYTLLILLLLYSQASLAEAKKHTPTLKPIEVERAIIMADAARKEAASVEGEWRGIRKMLLRARAAIWEENLELAMELAIKAQKLAKLGYAQAVEQSELDMPEYLQERK